MIKLKYSYRSAFTILELAIVLVVIGLIVGGILGGVALKHGAAIQSLMTDEVKYVEAARQFKEKYAYLPGDFPNATNYWGTDPNGCPDIMGNQTPMVKTCNGNGNGYIESSGTGQNNTPDQKYENFRAWQQLANAGYIDGTYTGTYGPTGWLHNVPGLNVPATKLATGGFEWMTFNADAVFAAGNWAGGQNYQQYLLLGSTTGSYGGAWTGQDLVGFLLTPADAYAIDKKMDDGIPTSGNVLASQQVNWSPVTYYCLDSTFTTYNTSQKIPGCSLLFKVKW